MDSSMMNLISTFDPLTGRIPGRPLEERRLSDLRGRFVDGVAYEQALQAGDRVVYAVCSVEQPPAEGQLNLAVGWLAPGKIGEEYFMTKGHFHAWRPAAEIYLGLSGSGCLLLESDDDGLAQLVPLQPNAAVYVPGHTAHRTINTGPAPLVYMGVYPAQAGHDYAAIDSRNFRHVVVERNGAPVMVRRE
jgi:glucose-6-phosphate isomerase, archaeal